MKYLENEVLKVAVAAHGAELSSVYDKEADFERIWCADPSVWNRHAPILFPFVGKCKGGTYTYAGKEYVMKTQHGFARDKEFDLVSADEKKVVYVLKATEETKEIYPFDFELIVTHELDEQNPRVLRVKWEVKNNGDDKMYYFIGGHPGFNLLDGYTRYDYYIAVPGKDEYKLTELAESGFGAPWIDSKLTLEEGLWKITDKVVDTVIFDYYQVDEISLVNPDKTPFVTMKCAGFPSMAVWANANGPFVCLEPWVGRTDNDDTTGVLNERPDVQMIEAGTSKLYEYTIEFH